MKYPMLNNCLMFKRINAREIEAKDWLNDNTYMISNDLARYARRLDGKRNPYHIDPSLSKGDVDYIMGVLEENELLRHKNILMKDFGTIFYTLWLPKRSKKLCTIAVIYTLLLKVFWLPVFCIGVWIYSNGFAMGGGDYYLAGSLGGALAGLFAHELAHMFSGITYGARIFEMGIMVQNFIPGAYVLLSIDEIKSKKDRVDILAAGIQTNILFAGICLILARIFPSVGLPFVCSAISNTLLALINLIFINGLDGASIISEFLGIQNITDIPQTVLLSKKKRRRLLAKGPSGYAIIMVSIIFQLLQAVLPLLIAINVLEVIACL